MPIYAYGIKRNPLHWQGNKIGKAYRYGTLVYQSLSWVLPANFASLSSSRYSVTAAAVPDGNVILSAGGYDGSSRFSVVELYNEAGARTVVNSLRSGKYNFAGYGHGSFAFFAGGSTSSTENTNQVDRYDSSGVRSALSNLDYNVQNNAAAEAGNCVLFAGGRVNALTGQKAFVNAYDQNGTKSSLSDLSNEVQSHAGASCDHYAFFGYGIDGSSYPTGVTIFNPSLVRTTTSGSQRRNDLAAAKCGEGVIFAGGITMGSSSPRTNVVEHFSKSGVKTTYPTLSSARCQMAIGELNGMTVIAGGGEQNNASSTGVTTIEVYDNTGVKVSMSMSLNIARRNAGYATLNGTLYIVGGRNSSTTVDTIETISYK